jgi:hypothetical protein
MASSRRSHWPSTDARELFWQASSVNTHRISHRPSDRFSRILGTAGKRISFALRLFTSVPDPTGAGDPSSPPILSYDNLFIPVQMIDGLTDAVAPGHPYKEIAR